MRGWSLVVVVASGCGRLAFDELSPADASPCDPAEVRVTNAPGASELQTMVWAGDRFALCWEDHRNATFPDGYCRFLGANGVPLGPDFDMITDGAQVPALAWNGSDLIAAYTDNRDGDYDIYVALFDLQGVRVTPDLEISTTIGVAWRPAIALLGNELAIAYYDSRDEIAGDGQTEIYLARTTATAGAVLGDVRVSNAPGSSYDPNIVATGTGYGIAWWDGRFGRWDAFYTQMSPAGVEVGDDRSIESETEDATNVSLTNAANDLDVAYTNGPSGGPQWINVQRVAVDGTPLAAPQRVSPADQNAVKPSLVHTEAGTAVAWADLTTGAIWFVLDGEQPRQVSGAGAVGIEPTLVAATDGWGVAWTDARFGEREIYFARVCR